MRTTADSAADVASGMLPPVARVQLPDGRRLAYRQYGSPTGSRRLCLHHPWRAWLTWWGVRLAARRFPSRLIAQTSQALPEPDRRALADPDFARTYIRVLADALAAGPAGACLDMALMAGDWDLRPERIRTPVSLWQGEQDNNAPPQTARHLATLIPGSVAHFLPDDGHLSIIGSQGARILANLTPTNPAPHPTGS